ncbi:MAG: 2-hydroxychromene-2-carboxylate isomerase [Gammaproteobacteria bacterium]|jgi:2-hydroxychromene-2-carboxylate isomerase
MTIYIFYPLDSSTNLGKLKDEFERLRTHMSRTISWYFDFISPFAYLQQSRFPAFPADIEIDARPVLFAGLLNHWENKGPAEIAAKRIFTYQHAVWLGKKHGIPLRMPPAHPFVPLKALRLAIALDNDLQVINKIFNYIWQDGLSLDDDSSWIQFTRGLGVDKPEELINQPDVKQTLRNNTEEAIDAGIFGVPTILADGHLFWGFDATDMYLDYQKNPGLFDDPELRAIDDLPKAAQRRKA